MNARELIAEITRRTVTGDNTTLLFDLDGWDSLKGVQLVLKLEQLAGRQLTENELERLQSIQDVEAILQASH
jgi:acyl carrier protein